MWLRQPASVDMYLDEVLRHARASSRPPGRGQRLAYVVEQVQALALRQRPCGWRFLGRQPARRAAILLQHGAGGRTATSCGAFCGGAGRTTPGLLRADCPRRRPGSAPAARPAAARRAAHVARPPLNCRCAAGALLFYRAHAQSGDTAVFDALLAAPRQGVNPLALAIDSLKTPSTLAAVRALAQERGVDVVLNATSFAIVSLDGRRCPDRTSAPVLLAGDAPVLQLITAGGTRETVAGRPAPGLTPRDLTAMHVVLPEVDGRITTRAISFKGLARRCERTEVDVVRYEPGASACLRRRAGAALVRCGTNRRRQAPGVDPGQLPNDDARLANGVGLDTPASTLAMLARCRARATTWAKRPPAAGSSDALMRALVAGRDQRPCRQPRPPGVAKPGAGGPPAAAFSALAPEEPGGA